MNSILVIYDFYKYKIKKIFLLQIRQKTLFVKVKEPTVATSRHLRDYVVIYFVLFDLRHPQTVNV